MYPPVWWARAAATWAATSAGVYVRPSEKSWSHGTSVALSPASFARKSRSEYVTVAPGALGDGQAPHIDVSVFARGLLDRLVTRIYLPDEAAANARDPLLASLPPDRATTLVARKAGERELEFDIHLQGERETVFLEI